MATNQEHDPRRAKPGQTFSYVAPAEVTEGEGKKSRKVTRLKEHTFKADDDGVVRPSNADEVRVLDGFGLPVARSAKADENQNADATSAKGKE